MIYNIVLFIINFDSSASFFINMIANSVFYEEFFIMINGVKKYTSFLANTGTQKNSTAKSRDTATQEHNNAWINLFLIMNYNNFLDLANQLTIFSEYYLFKQYFYI